MNRGLPTDKLNVNIILREDQGTGYEDVQSYRGSPVELSPSSWQEYLWRELNSLLSNKAIPLKHRARAYNACIRSTMTYGAVTWALTERRKPSADLQQTYGQKNVWSVNHRSSAQHRHTEKMRLETSSVDCANE